MSDRNNNFFSRLKDLKSSKSGPVSSKDSSKKNNYLRSMKSNRRFPSFAQWLHLVSVLDKTEQFVFKISAGVLLVSIIFLGVFVYNGHLTLAPSVGGSYTEALVGAPKLINPLYSSANDIDQDLVRLVYSGLMRIDPSNGLVTDLAESYTISEDEKVYTFSLRDDATWHDGSAVTPRDIIFTFDAIQSQSYISPLRNAFLGMQIEQVDERTVSFILDEPFAPFLSTLTVGILPADYWGGIDPSVVRLAEQNLFPRGSGPYMFDGLKKDKTGNILEYTVTRYDGYYGDKAKINDITFKFYDSVDLHIDALLSKKVEGIAVLPLDRLNEIKELNSVQIISPTLPQVNAIYFNLEHDIVGEEDVRKALGAAINKDAIISDSLSGNGIVANSAIPSFYQTDSDVYDNATPYNLDVARTLLDDLGWKLNEGDETRVKGSGDDALRLELTIVTTDTPEMVAVSNQIASMWNEIGVHASVKPVDPALFREEVVSKRDYDILVTGIKSDSGDPDPYPIWHSSQTNNSGLNLSLYAIKKTDDLIEEARMTSDLDKRKKLYEEFSAQLKESVPAIFLYQPTYFYAISSKIRGIEIDSIINPADRFGQVNEWYLKTDSIFSW